MLFSVLRGYRVLGIDRRGHGRSSQVSDGHDMDHYAADAAAVVEHLDLRNAVHIGHSTGGGEVTRYVARHGKGRVAKAVLMSAVPPIMVKSPNNPDGLPIEVFDGYRKSLAANRAQFYCDVAANPFYGFNRPGVKRLDGVIENWWRQGMMGGAKAHYDGIKASSETDLTEDLKSIDVPTLVMQGDDGQIVPYKGAALLQAKLVKNATLKLYPGFPHGMLTTRPPGLHPRLGLARDTQHAKRAGDFCGVYARLAGDLTPQARDSRRGRRRDHRDHCVGGPQRACRHALPEDPTQLLALFDTTALAPRDILNKNNNLLR
jgi:non-heme chloroperoxidase